MEASTNKRSALESFEDAVFDVIMFGAALGVEFSKLLAPFCDSKTASDQDNLDEEFPSSLSEQFRNPLNQFTSNSK